MSHLKPISIVVLLTILSCGTRMSTVPHAVTALVRGSAEKPAPGHAIYLIGGDSRGDGGHVLPWAFKQAADAGARGFIFLGDMEWSRRCDQHFQTEELAYLGNTVPLYPALGNHEVRWLGWLKYPKEARQAHKREFQERFLRRPEISLPPQEGVAKTESIFYSVDLDSGNGKKGLHFIALDNVSQSGFGSGQIGWLREDLAKARRDAQFLIVGMHKPFARNCTGSHSMEEDGRAGLADSDQVLNLLAGEGAGDRPVDMIFASHDHYFAQFFQEVGGKRIKTYVSGGLGAHLKSCTCGDCGAFHHALQLDVGDKLEVSVIRWPGEDLRATPGREDDDDDEDDGESTWPLNCATRERGPVEEGGQFARWGMEARDRSVGLLK
jgi:hypothetical protein